MAITAFTPGPWNLDEDDFSIMAEVGAHIARVTDIGDLPCVDTDDEEKVQNECLANARLLAASPDLYEALSDVLKSYRSYRLREGDDETSDSIDLAEQVLIKAVEGAGH